ncbi:hypothetical protein GCM10027298_19110 [Epidermidibacterium keratini]
MRFSDEERVGTHGRAQARAHSPSETLARPLEGQARRFESHQIALATAYECTFRAVLSADTLVLMPWLPSVGAS